MGRYSFFGFLLIRRRPWRAESLQLTNTWHLSPKNYGPHKVTRIFYHEPPIDTGTPDDLLFQPVGLSPD